jgi:hypothetical protein
MNKRDVLLNTAAHKPALDQFAASFSAIERREHWRSSEIVTRFLDAAFRAIRGKFLLGKAWDENESEYMRIVKQCRTPKETMSDLAAMLGATTLALQAEPIDFIGPVYSAFAANPHIGQFFTPWSVSRMMAELTIGSKDDLRRMLRKQRFIMLGEPACGVGGMVLAANQVLQERGLDIARQAHWVAVDVDFRAVCGAYIQTALTGASASIVHGDTLRGETWGVTQTPAYWLFPKALGDKPQLPPAVYPPAEHRRRRATAAEAGAAPLIVDTAAGPQFAFRF